MKVARKSVEEAIRINHPIKLCMALLWAMSVFLWSDDLDSAEEYADRFVAQADKHSLAPYQTIGLGAKGELLLRRGDVEGGMILLRRSGCVARIDTACLRLQQRTGGGPSTTDEATKL